MADLYSNPWYIITMIGDPFIWIFICAFLVLVCAKMKKSKLRSTLLLIVMSVLIAAPIVYGLKFFVPSPRPCEACVINPENCNPFCLPENSFPSGHTDLIFTVFTSIYISAGRKKLLIIFVIPCLVAVSRYVLGVHYWFDILAGFLIGICVPVMLRKYGKQRWFDV